MRLSEWRAAAPNREAGGAKVAAVVDSVLLALGTGPDPHGWIAWGEEPATRYTIFVPTDPGLVLCFVRVLVPGEGPRASAKLVRWNKVSIGELAIEAQQGHRLISVPIEQQVLRGVDAEADRVAAFALRLIAAIDGRPLPPPDEAPARRGRSASAASAARARSAAPVRATSAPKTASASRAASTTKAGGTARPRSRG